jgi:alanyl-tRNA synthetase/REP element-mobilizing transposase RayT
MMTSTQIRPSSQLRKDFLDFFKSKQHTIVPSSSLLPDSPNLLFTNAGMNQFVPIFLGQVKCPYKPGRAADTQKCIRAGGKHNDLEDVGLDTYHHTFFEMLGNWSFGDYFKKEAIEWAWELVTSKKWFGFPPERLYATVYKPGPGEPSEFDQEAYDHWEKLFKAAGLDPKVHICTGGKKDNFWMMGDTGPCGPCSEIHVDLTPAGDTKGSLVNQGDARCIEIWNLVFIQFNANPDGTFSPLPAKHVDTGMGFERVTSIIQCTKGFTDFANAKISNYETDIFRPIFDALEKLSGKKYGSTLPGEHTRPRVSQSAPSPIAHEASGTSEAKYSRRNLPHFERPWAKYMVTFSTRERRQLNPSERDLVLKSVLYAHEQRQYQLFAACVMPDHVHVLFEPEIKEQDKEGKPVFWSLSEILQGIKSTSAHQLNKTSGRKEQVWEKESMDRMIRGQSDMEEKFHYICRNPWDSGVVPHMENYPWLWTPEGNTRAEDAVGGAPTAAREGACAPPEVAQPLPQSEQEKVDIAFRVIADHIRTLSFAIADGIQPGNNDRNYVLRRILRRAVRYGRTLGFREPFFYKLVDVLADTMGDVFPEIRAREKHVQEVIRTEEEAFNRTLDKGLNLFESALNTRKFFKSKVGEFSEIIERLEGNLNRLPDNYSGGINRLKEMEPDAKKLSNLVNGFAPNNSVQETSAVTGFALFISAYVENAIATSEKSYLTFIEKYPIFLNSAKKALAEVKLWKDDEFGGREAFVLYDTYGFPFDLTDLMARERGMTVDYVERDRLLDEQRARGRASQKKEVISLSQIETTTPTKFVGYENLAVQAKVLEVVSLKNKTAVILDTSACYAEMGGQVGDTGDLIGSGQLWRVTNTQKSGNTWLHFIEEGSTRASRVADRALAVSSGASAGGAVPSNIVRPSVADEASATAPEAGALPIPGNVVTLSVDAPRRNAIQRHHTVTHLLHWALHKVVSHDASQKGSFVGPDKLTFDFNSAPLTPQQVADIEKLVNERILENAPVTWFELPYADVKKNTAITQFFGEKYGDTVRVLQIGGERGKLNGYSMELCGGTHTRATGEIGLFRIVGENAIAAGVRRIEAVAGLEAYRQATDEVALIKLLAGKVNSPVHELEKKIESLLEHQKAMEKQMKIAQQREASNAASNLLEEIKTINGVPAIIHNLGSANGDFLQSIADSLKGRFKGVIVLGSVANGAVALVAAVSPDFTAKVQAGKIIQTIAPIVGGKGGGKPDNARGGGKDASKLDEALAKAKSLLG